MAIFNLSEKTPDIKERLKGTVRLLAVKSFANSIIFIRMLLGPVVLLLLRSDIMSIISLFEQGLVKIDSLHGFFKKWLKDLWAKLIFDWIFVATVQKILLNKPAIFLGAVRRVSLSFRTLGITEPLHFKEIIDFIPLHRFLMFSRLVLKYSF